MKRIITSFFIASFFLVSPVLANITPNDVYYGNQWYLAKVKADLAWEKISSSPDIVIAVIDSGIQTSHPDLQANIWQNSREIPGNKIDDDHNGFIDDAAGWDFVNNVPDPAPKFASGWTESGVTHGTVIAGIIAAQGNNQAGVSGVTWQAKIMPLKAINDKGEGRTGDVVRAIDYAVKNGADIINLSFMSFNYSGALQEAIARAHNAGVIVVAAAGNEQSGGEGYDIDQTPIYPACYDGDLGENMVIGVVATDALDQKAKFSSYGSRCVDIAAPGISFFSTITVGSDALDSQKAYGGYWSGTSMATPLVSAALALIEQANPELERREIVNILFASTDDISRLNPAYPGQLGNGRLNINRAVELAKEKLYSRVGRLVIAPASISKTKAEDKKDWKLTAVNGNLAQSLPDTSGRAALSLSAGDVDADGQEEMIVGAGAGEEPRVRVINSAGKVRQQFLAFDKSFRGGVNLAGADLDGDGKAEIIAVQASAGSGQVRIFNNAGKLQKQFLVDSKRWRGGLSVAVGNVDGQGTPEIIVGYGQGSEPMIKIFSSSGRLTSAFLAYEKKFRGGVRVASANLDGRRNHNSAEIIAAPGRGRDPLVKIFDNRAAVKKQFLAYTRNWQGGVFVAAGDLNNDGLAEIATGVQPGGAPHVRVFSGKGELMESFYAWDESFNGGANIGIIRVNN